MAKDKKETKNRGVNICSDSLRDSTDGECRTQIVNPSLSKMKHDLQAVIDLMGPATPKCKENNYSDIDDKSASTFTEDKNRYDNEDISCMSSNTQKTLESDLSLQFQENEVGSVAADMNTYSCSEVEDQHEAKENGCFKPVISCETCKLKLNQPCPPPLMPAHICMHPGCVCAQMAAEYVKSQDFKSDKTIICKKNKNSICHWFKNMGFAKHSASSHCEYYKMNVKKSESDKDPPKRLVFDLVDKSKCYVKGNEQTSHHPGCLHENPEMKNRTKEIKNINNEKLLKPIIKDPSYCKQLEGEEDNKTYIEYNDTTKVDVYYFDHGCLNYLKTTDRPPLLSTDVMAQKTEDYTTKFWAEFFGAVNICISFCTSFILQLIRFVLHSVLRPLTVGLTQLLSDYFFKPCLTTMFNSVIQPPMILLQNIALTFRDVCRPIAEGFGFFFREISHVIMAFRIVDVKQEKYGKCNCSLSVKNPRSEQSRRNC